MSIVDDSKHACGRPIRLLAHDLFNQAVKRQDAVFDYAVAKDFGTMHIQGGKVGPGSCSFVFVLDESWPCGGRLKRWMLATTRLNTGLFVGGEHMIVRSEGLPLPAALVEVEDGSDLLNKQRIAGKDPTSMQSWTESIFAEPAPDGGSTDLCYEALIENFLSDVPPRRNEKAAVPCGAAVHKRELLPERRDCGGKAGLTPTSGFVLEAWQAGQTESLAPFADDLPRRVQSGGDHLLREALGREEDDLVARITSQYGDVN
jgi:hypothetical protein